MANHELNITCRNCSNEFDARLHGTQCPNCKAQHTFNPNKPKIMRKLFHINENTMLQNGYKLKSYFDKNDHKLNFTDLRVDTYSKEIRPGWTIEVGFLFQASHKNKPYELIESTSELLIHGDSESISCESIEDLNEFESKVKELFKLKEVA